MSKAWSIGKTDRFKMSIDDKNRQMLMNVGPGSYTSNNAVRRSMPNWR